MNNGITLCTSCHKFSLDSIHNNPIVWYDRLTRLNVDKEKLLTQSKQLNRGTFNDNLNELWNQCKGMLISNKISLLLSEKS